MRRHAAFIVAPLLGLACTPQPLLLQLPFADGAQSALVVVDADGKSEIYAVDLPKRNEQVLLGERPGIDDDTPLRIAVASYAQAIDELGLAQGRVLSAAVGSALPAALDVTGAVIGRGPPSFAHQDSLPPALMGFRIPTLCRALLDAERWEVADPVYYSVGLAATPDGQVGLMIARDGADANSMFMLPDGAGGLQPIDMIPEASMHVSATGIDPSLGSWLAGGAFDRGGLVARYAAPGQLAFVLSGTQPMLTTEWPVVFDFADPSDGPDALYAVVSSGALVRIIGDRVERLSQVDTFGGLRPPLAIAGPDEVYYAPPNGYEMHHYQGGVDSIETTDLDQFLREGRDSLHAIGVTRDGVAFAGSQLGPILKRDERGHWALWAREVVVGGSIWSMEPFGDDGMLIGMTYGKIVQVYSSLPEPCPDTINTGTNDVTLYIHSLPERKEIWVGGYRGDTQAGVRYPYLARIGTP